MVIDVNASTSSRGSTSPLRHATSSNQTDRLIRDVDILPEEFDASIKLLFVVLYLVIIVLGFCGNVLVIVVVAVHRQLRTVTNMFIVSLAVSDALIAAFNMPFQLDQYIANFEWKMGEPMCKISRYLQGVVIVCSIQTLTGIAVDR